VCGTVRIYRGEPQASSSAVVGDVARVHFGGRAGGHPRVRPRGRRGWVVL